jgi:hypothetical protein
LLNVNSAGEKIAVVKKRIKKSPSRDGQRLHTAIYMYGITLFGKLALKSVI